MNIQSVEFIGLRTPLQAPAVFSWGTAQERNVGLVRVRLTDGTDGWGETSVTFPLWSLEERAATVRGIAPIVEGERLEDIADIAAITAKLRRSTDRLRLLWSHTALSAAIGAIEMALWDLWGRIHEKPVWEMLGGTDAKIPLYAVGFGGTPAEVAARAAEFLDEGYAAVKVRVGFDQSTDLALIEAVSEVAGDRLYADANMGWSREQANEMVRQLNRFGLGWLEEPLSRDDLAGMSDLRELATMPLAAGENCYTGEELVNLATSGMVDVVMPDLARVGGLTAAIDGARAAQSFGLGYSTHHYASDIGFAAMAAMCSVVGDSWPMLRDVSPWQIRTELLSEALDIESGTARPYAGPGLAPAPVVAVMEEYRVL